VPLYEYACRACGARTERMRKVAERLAGLECSACGSPMVLAMSAPGLVGGGSTVASSSGDRGDSCAPGGCCGGGSCSPSLN
jgi:putative FmdB family regulatory protein